MTKAISFSDLHVHNYNRFVSGTIRLENTVKALRLMFETANKLGIKYILFSGDLYHQQGSIPVSVSYALKNEFKELFEQYRIQFIAITGNHDQATKQVYGKEATSALKELDLLFEDFMLIDNNGITMNNTNIYGIPYYEFKEHFSQALDDTVIFSQDLSAAVGRSGKKVINILLTHQTPTHENSNIPVDIDITDERIRKFDLVLNGHIHKHEVLSDNFINVGSTIPRDKEDSGQEKGYLIIDLENPRDSVFHSLNELFPQIILKTDGEELTEWESNQYVIRTPVIVVDEDIEIDTKEFDSSLKNSTLVENYGKELELSEELIQTGLKYL